MFLSREGPDVRRLLTWAEAQSKDSLEAELPEQAALFGIADLAAVEYATHDGIKVIILDSLLGRARNCVEKGCELWLPLRRVERRRAAAEAGEGAPLPRAGPQQRHGRLVVQAAGVGAPRRGGGDRRAWHARVDVGSSAGEPAGAASACAPYRPLRPPDVQLPHTVGCP